MQLTKENYFSLEANQHYMSVSQFKGFLPSYGGCEAQSMALLSGEYERPRSETFVEGHFAHAWNEGVLEEFKANNPELISSQGPTKGQLKSNFKHCETMIETLENDPLVMKALAGKKEVIMTAELFGIQWKVMLDSHQPNVGDFGMFADLKALKDVDGKWWNKEVQAYENFLEHYGYDVQMSVYAEVERLNTNKEHWAIPHLVIVTKQKTPDKRIIYFDYDLIQSKLNLVENNIERVKAVKSGEVDPIMCNKCPYCLSKKKAVVEHYSVFNIY